MKRYTLFLALAFSSSMFAQQSEKTSKLCIAGAFDYSVINNRKEVRGSYKAGMNGRIMYLTRSFFGLSGEFTYHFPHNTAPALENIYSWNADINGHFICDVGESDLKFSAILGVDFMDWRGTYVGPSLNDNNKYRYGMLLEQNWIAANMGFGFNHDFGKRVNGFGEFKVRMTTEEGDLFGVCDASFNFGIRLNVLEIRKKEADENGKRGRKHRNPGRMYKWLPK